MYAARRRLSNGWSRNRWLDRALQLDRCRIDRCIGNNPRVSFLPPALSPAVTAFLAAAPQGPLIAGQRRAVDASRRFLRHDPATGSPLAEVADAGAAEVQAAVAAARRAFDEGGWSAAPPAVRGQALHRLADVLERDAQTLASLISLEQGKPLQLALEADVGGAIEYCRYYAGLAQERDPASWQSVDAHHSAYLLRQPVGVVAAIVPWNSPLVLAAAKFAAALAAGCTVILKPAEFASLSSSRLTDAFVAADFPPGVINVLTGQGAYAGQALSQHPQVDFIAFTGSTSVGRSVLTAAASNFKRVALELGGKSPLLVFADADLPSTIDAVCAAIFSNSGQVCVAGSRLYVERSVHAALLAGIVERTRALRLGHGLQPRTDIGPLTLPGAAQRARAALGDACAAGAILHCGGDITGPIGSFLTPAVLSELPQDSALWREELFAPVLTVAPFDSVEQALGYAEDSPYGLSASLWTGDEARARWMAERLRVGTVWINTHGMFAVSLPNGGMKQSGWGRDGGPQGLEQYLETKTVCMRR